jgi:hypothetical protein
MAGWRIAGREDNHVANLRPIPVSGGERDGVWISVSIYGNGDYAPKTPSPGLLLFCFDVLTSS